MVRQRRRGECIASIFSDGMILMIRRFVPGLKHMGEPESFFIILRWIYKLFGIQANPGAQMATIPFKPKFP